MKSINLLFLIVSIFSAIIEQEPDTSEDINTEETPLRNEQDDVNIEMEDLSKQREDLKGVIVNRNTSTTAAKESSDESQKIDMKKIKEFFEKNNLLGIFTGVFFIIIGLGIAALCYEKSISSTVIALIAGPGFGLLIIIGAIISREKSK